MYEVVLQIKDKDTNVEFQSPAFQIVKGQEELASQALAAALIKFLAKVNQK
jgi:hypothetical protein